MRLRHPLIAYPQSAQDGDAPWAARSVADGEIGRARGRKRTPPGRRAAPRPALGPFWVTIQAGLQKLACVPWVMRPTPRRCSLRHHVALDPPSPPPPVRPPRRGGRRHGAARPPGGGGREALGRAAVEVRRGSAECRPPARPRRRGPGGGGARGGVLPP